MKRNIFFKTILLILLLLQIYSVFIFVFSKEYLEAIGIFLILLFNMFILVFQKITNIHINQLSILLIFILSTFHSFFGKTLKLYDNTLWWDKFLHFYGTLSASLLCISFFKKLNFLKNNSKPFIFIFTFILGGFLGQLFEVLEHTIDALSSAQSQHGLNDTMIDIILNNIGGLIAAFLTLNKKSYD
ncbi:hypothetical protein [Tepidibacter formicigenes]|jgi:hypothetical protein|uniref:VanZ like family protein n=1 Tax=Tepidibacter formicigenes DSM 15518 TaxID=1123349 RepID=A0A1M6RDF3_9FIRM|nr:hypothetical protein [Tepidibacter formicigenes]SHK30377.1 hypothetical protein SAMN02744037_02078 [Tepidibacter formicigenes DSM 15518]